MSPATARYAPKKAPVLTVTALKELIKLGQKGELLEQQFMVPPTVAKKILDGLNASNRSLNDVHSKSLSRDINNKNWIESTGAMVTFDAAGRLLDGQHRLNAISFSDVPLRLSLKFGLPEEAKKVIDTGRKRTQIDYIRMVEGQEAKYKAERSSVARLIYGFLKDPEHPYNYASNYKPTQSDLIAISDEFGQGILDAVQSVYAPGHMGRIVIQSYPAFLGFLASYTPHADKVPQFFELLASGANMGADHPIMVCRNRLLTRDEFRVQKNKERTLGLLIRTWNLWVRGEKTSNKMHTPDALVRMEGLTTIGKHKIYAD